MAWRIDEAIIRGEIDNRTKGRIWGRLWVVGREEPIDLNLAGNPWRDLAGHRLEFINPHPKAMDLSRFPTRQNGVIGDCTASRKVKIPDIPMDQIGEYYAAKKPWTWHWGNSLYFEWFSSASGRVVVESASYQLTVDAEGAWEMAPQEEEAQRRANAEAMTNFVEELGRSNPAARDHAGARGTDTTHESRGNMYVPGKILTEEEADRLEEENEQLLYRVRDRMEDEGAEADFEQILNDELARRLEQRGNLALTPDEEHWRDRQLHERNRPSGESASGENADGSSGCLPEHPVARRAYDLTVMLIDDPEKRGWIPDEAGEEHPLVALSAAMSRGGAKLAWAIDEVEWPPEIGECATSIARLKRARRFFEDAVSAAEISERQKLGENEWLAEARRQLKELMVDCDTLMAELRERLSRGFD